MEIRTTKEIVSSYNNYTQRFQKAQLDKIEFIRVDELLERLNGSVDCDDAYDLVFDLRMELTPITNPSKDDLENDTICSHCKGHADIIIPNKVKLCKSCYNKQESRSSSCEHNVDVGWETESLSHEGATPSTANSQSSVVVSSTDSCGVEQATTSQDNSSEEIVAKARSPAEDFNLLCDNCNHIICDWSDSRKDVNKLLHREDLNYTHQWNHVCECGCNSPKPKITIVDSIPQDINIIKCVDCANGVETTCYGHTEGDMFVIDNIEQKPDFNTQFPTLRNLLQPTKCFYPTCDCKTVCSQHIQDYCIEKRRVMKARDKLFKQFIFTTTDDNRPLRTIQMRQEDFEEFEREVGL